MPPPRAASRSTSSAGAPSNAGVSSAGEACSSAANALSPTRFTPSAAESAIFEVNRRIARSASSLPGITKSTTVGSQLVSTTATTGMPSLRASLTAIASLFESTMKSASGSRFMVLMPARLACINEERIRQPLHGLDAGQVGLQVLPLPLQLDNFLFGQQLVAAVNSHLIQFLKALHRLLHGHPVGEQPAEPALVDVRHPRAIGLFGHGFLGLALGADEENRLAAGAQLSDELRRVLEQLERLLQVDDVDPIALAKNVFLHLWIPALGLMPEVNTRFEQLLHCDRGHWPPLWIASGLALPWPEFIPLAREIVERRDQ